MSKKVEPFIPRWLRPFKGHGSHLMMYDSNVFGSWAVVRWPAMPPEARHIHYVPWWFTDHVRAGRPQPTLELALAQIPIRN